MNGTWTELEVEGHPCHLFEPEPRQEIGFSVIYLHGKHQRRLQDHPEFVKPFAERGLPIIVPETGRSWWVDRDCPDFPSTYTAESYVLQAVMPFIAERWGATPGRVALVGTSMGGQGALRIAYKNPNQFPVVCAISPAIDFQKRWEEGDTVLRAMYSDKEAARQETALLYVRPLDYPRHQFFCCDPADSDWWESVDRLHMKLASLGVPFESDLESTAGGHGFEYYTHMAPRVAEFVAEKLEFERRRLV